MAVPKKRRLNYKILNHGIKRSTLISYKIYSMLIRLAASYLNKSLYKVARLASMHQKTIRVGSKLRLPLKASCNKKHINLVKTRYTWAPFKHHEEALESIILNDNREFIVDGMWYRTRIRKKSVKRFTFKRLRRVLPWYIKFNLVSPYKPRFYLVSHTSIFSNISYKNFLLRNWLRQFQLPHRYGSQGNFLLKEWELTPSYLNFSPAYGRLFWFTGIPPRCGWINLPTNLYWPKGPTLRQLWNYAKTNPNEGYWIYCMWLQVWKRWKRWFRFPYVYFWRRAPLKRKVFYNYFISNLILHSNIQPFLLHYFGKLSLPLPKHIYKCTPRGLKHSWVTSLGFKLDFICKKILTWSKKIIK